LNSELFSSHVHPPNNVPQKAILFTKHPGLIIIPEAFGQPKTQRLNSNTNGNDDYNESNSVQFIKHPAIRSAIKKCLRDWTRRPNVTNLDTHYILSSPLHDPDEGLWNMHEREWTQRVSGVSHIDTLLERRNADTPRDGDQYDEQHGKEKENRVKDGISKGDLDPVLKRVPGIDPPTSPTPLLAPLPISKAIKDLRWSSVGLQYNWTTKEYHLERAVKVPETLAQYTTVLIVFFFLI
jgi:hypothetical protein